MPWGAYDPAFSPDGQYIAYTARPDYRINDLFIMTREGKNQVQITTNGHARAPVWSLDGKKLAFLSDVEGAQFNIYVMEVSPRRYSRRTSHCRELRQAREDQRRKRDRCPLRPLVDGVGTGDSRRGGTSPRSWHGNC